MSLDKATRRKIKTRLNTAARKIDEVVDLLRENGIREGGVFCEGSGYIHAVKDFDNFNSSKVLVTSEHARQHPTVENDLAFLSKSNLVFLDKGEFTTTPSGDDRVKEILW